MAVLQSGSNKKTNVPQLLIGVVFLTIVGSLVLLSVDPASRVAQARDARRKNDLRSIANALEAYFVENGNYPHSCARSDVLGAVCASSKDGTWHTPDLNAVLDVLVEGDYLKNIPRDPLSFNSRPFSSVWQQAGNSYFYISVDDPRVGATAGEYFILGTFLEETSDPATLDNLGGEQNARPRWPDCESKIGFDGRAYIIRSFHCNDDPGGSL